MNTNTCTVGGMIIDLSRVTDCSFDMDGNLSVYTDGNTERVAMKLTRADADIFMVHYNNHQLHKTSPTPTAQSER